MFAQMSPETRGSYQGGVSLSAKQTTSRIQSPCVRIQEYTQTIKTPGQDNPSDQCYARYYSVSTRDGHATTIMTVRGEGEGGGKRTHRTAAAVLTLAFPFVMLAELPPETRGSCQGEVSLTAKQTTSRIQSPCVQIQDYSQTIKTPGQDNPSDQCYARYYSVSARDRHATTVMTVRGEGGGGGKRTHLIVAAVLTPAFPSVMLAELSPEKRGSCQGGVSLTAKQTTSGIQSPCVQTQEYTQTIETRGQENLRKAFCAGRLAAP